MSKEGVKVVIMDREFTVACKKNEKDDLLEAAAHLDKQLRMVQQWPLLMAQPGINRS